jgi:glutathione S-transferase
MAEVVLWHFPISHFNEKVRWALDWKGIPHRRRALSFDYLPRALWATGRPTLPILFLDGRAIGDSTRIIEALEGFKPEPPLYPREAPARRRALELEDFLDEELGHAMRTALLGPLFATNPDGVVGVLSLGMTDRARRTMRALFPAFRAYYKLRHRIAPPTIEVAPAQVRAALDRIAAELQPSGYLVGDHFSVADLTAAALLWPLVLPPEFQYLPTGDFHVAFAEFRDPLTDHPACRWAAGIYRRHRGVSAEVAA